MSDHATIEEDRTAETVAQEPQNAGAVTLRDGEADAIAHPASPPPPATVQMIQQLIDAASRPDTDIEKMERMFAMAEKMQASQAEREYQDAMAAAKSRYTPFLSGPTPLPSSTTVLALREATSRGTRLPNDGYFSSR